MEKNVDVWNWHHAEARKIEIESGNAQQILLQKIKIARVYTIVSHRSRVTHICISKWAIIGSYNRLSPVRRHAIT